MLKTDLAHRSGVRQPEGRNEFEALNQAEPEHPTSKMIALPGHDAVTRLKICKSPRRSKNHGSAGESFDDCS
jgi:hypothetical protein